MTAATATMAPAATTTAAAPACCPSCGFDIGAGNSSSSTSDAAQQEDLLAAQARIQELESHVRQLNQKATAAVERWAGYEAELAKLRSQQQRQQQQQQQQRATPAPLALPGPATTSASPPGAAVVSPTRTSFLQSAPGRLSALLYPRKSTPNLRGGDVTPGPGSPTTATPTSGGTTTTVASTTEGLLEALTREQALRREAEGRLSATSREVEELSVSLFEQANEMVAEERRARARLEERVGELERRDAEKRRRLERLEGAMGRIERVRNLLQESGDGPS
ncbi:exosome 3'-_5 exonuclease subunit ski4 [Purpureocillium lilacinum]|nr:exosome 3'->5 exonuclease subunit ski4 (Csl4) [Purpureocillium lilacinum]GJN85928.1 exosome 3'->5 exonuclease subunit ski4 [Purpureocillium lilacinum]